MRLGPYPNPSCGELNSPRATQRVKGSCYSRLWQPGTQDIFSSKNSKRCATVKTCLWYFFAQAYGCLKEKDDMERSTGVKDESQGLVSGVYFPSPQAGLITYTTPQALAPGARTVPLASEGTTGLSAVGPMVRDGRGRWFLSRLYRELRGPTNSTPSSSQSRRSHLGDMFCYNHYS